MSKLDKLEEKKKQLQAQIQAEKSKLRAEQRKLETRKKIVIGGAIQKMIESAPEDQGAKFFEQIKAYMSERDRTLFD